MIGLSASRRLGFGADGSLRGRPGYDPVVQALSEIMGASEATQSLYCTLATNDVPAAVLAALGTCAVLYQRATG